MHWITEKKYILDFFSFVKNPLVSFLFGKVDRIYFVGKFIVFLFFLDYLLDLVWEIFSCEKIHWI